MTGMHAPKRVTGVANALSNQKVDVYSASDHNIGRLDLVRAIVSGMSGLVRLSQSPHL